ncbi:hypothetical protein LOY97_000220 [Ophidiomyces ophidiicola]|nr:hypothetical protein LOZ49_005214 [Ophidiomyces ophidiicola]KAI2022458.1 hypothetical protein LOZ46_001941 [Ophidiomyces ophidiicola]KAI2143406.1 hypothetical protein LOZ29_001164 [Ophidiomyces ophidiicola]KAI2146122.1 hypothetical protein LOZ28_000926 [Ophidiomyces ophidiicola]KAI2224271.1 hypothetical protein LOZ15_000826 [Ophidiomyces ophidiicola]
MGRLHFHQNWIGDLLDNFIIESPDGIAWKFGKKLSEKATFSTAEITGAGKAWAEGTAVYSCRQIINGRAANEAIVKVRFQVPPEYPTSYNPEVRRKLALSNPTVWTQHEIASLRHFNQKGCKVTPKLLYVKRSLQEWEDLPVPGGYVVFILMQKVPGVPLIDFWKYDFDKREKIRAVFQESLKELFRYHARPRDTHLGNIIYDEEGNKCWFIDYEHIFVNETEQPRKFSEDDYFRWGLAYRGCSPSTSKW